MSMGKVGSRDHKGPSSKAAKFHANGESRRDVCGTPEAPAKIMSQSRDEMEPSLPAL